MAIHGITPYTFQREDAFRFANEQGSRTHIRGNELEFESCPFCHGGENHDKNTFSINLDSGQYNCKRETCKATGNMISLSKEFGFSLGKYADEYITPRKQYRTFKQRQKIAPKPPVIEYMQKRGIPEELVVEYQIYARSDRENIMVMPFFDENNVLAFIKYRRMDYQKGDKVPKEWPEKGCKPILYGMWLCDPSVSKTLTITEGQIDMLSAVAAGVQNVVSVPMGANGFTWIPYCWNWVHQFDELIVFGDCEKGHITLVDELSARMQMPIKVVRENDYMGCKDANEILVKHGADQVRKCVENASWVLPNTIEMVANVKYMDSDNRTKIPTGLNRADRILHGGVPSGVVTLITGRAGHGKSTFASQIIMNALAKGLTVFAYSGELPDSMFKMWIDFQVAGPTNVQTRNRPWGDDYFLLNETVEKINQWYAERFYLYASQDNGTETGETILTTVENVIQRYGAKVVLLDNLMTALSLSDVKGDNNLVRQSLFMRKLAAMARLYDVAIILVAHKRKETGFGDANDAISGSSDIVNLAGVVISYERSAEGEDGHRKVRITKNRIYGKTDYTGWTVDFEPKSKRIYGTGDDPYKDSGFDPGADPDGFHDFTEFDLDDDDVPFNGQEGG